MSRSFEIPKSSTLTKSSSSCPAADQHDVRRLEVAVDDVGGVRRLERAGDLRGDQQRPFEVQRPVAVDQLLEVRAVEVLHHEVERAVGRRARIGDVDDVGVADLRRRARLAPKSFDQVGAGVEAGVQHLDRDAPPDVDVVRLVDAAHRAFAAQPAHVVTAADAWSRSADPRPGAAPSRRVGAPAAGGLETVVAWAGAGAPGAGAATAPDSSALAPAISAWRSRRSSAISFAYSGRRNSTRRAASVLGEVSARKPARSARIASPSG